MATKLEVINNIMRRMREPQVLSSTENEYSTLIASILAEAYEEVLDEWNWRPVGELTYFTVPANTQSIVFSALNVTSGPVPDGRMVLSRDSGRTIVNAHENPPIGADLLLKPSYPLQELDLADFAYADLRKGESTNIRPTHFTLRPLPNETMQIYFSPIPDQETPMSMAYFRRPSRFTLEPLDDNTEFDIPFRPVQELALMYALNERGEEMGEPGNLAQGRYVQALSTAKEIDLKAGEHSNKYDWSRD